MKNKKVRNICISVFVIVWTLIFHYESIRYFYLNPLFKTELPKVKFLFPPAGWIMFYSVDDQYGHAEVYGVMDGEPQFIDPHEILQTRYFGYDNVHRNVLSTVLSSYMKAPFCRYLQRKLPDFESFLVTAVHYPSLTQAPHKRRQAVVYTCP